MATVLPAVYLAHSRRIHQGGAKMSISTVPLFGAEVAWSKGPPKD